MFRKRWNAGRQVRCQSESIRATDAARARACFESGYLWSAGIFAVRASVWIDAIGNFRPEILKACERAFRTNLDHELAFWDA